MKKWIVVLLLACILIVGCSAFFEAAQDPNSGLNKKIDATTALVKDPAINAGAGALPPPYGEIASGVLAVTGVLGTVFQTWRKKLTADKLQNVTTTTKAIVGAVETLSQIPATADAMTTLKTEVQNNLESSKTYQVGKAIITGLKS